MHFQCVCVCAGSCVQAGLSVGVVTPLLRGQAMAGTVEEVRGGAGANAKEVGDGLAALIMLVKNKEPDADGRQWADQVFVPADKVRSECWQQLSEGGGWPNVGWREAYAFALMALALHHMQRYEEDGGAAAVGDPVQALREAVKSLDLALIMSGSGCADLVHFFLSGIEPNVVAADAGSAEQREGDAANADDDTRYVIPSTLPAGRAPELSEACRIPRVRSPTFSDFKKNFFKKDKSVIIEGATDEWPARQRWQDLRYFRSQYGHRTVPVELGKLLGGRKVLGCWAEEALTMRDFIDKHLAPSNQACSQSPSTRPEGGEQQVAYLAQHALFEQLPRLHADLAPPEYTACGTLEAVNAWLGTAGTVTPLHHDSYDNLLTQVVGFKYVRLYEPKETKYLYVSKKGTGINAQGNVSPIDCESPDSTKYPLVSEATYTEAVLGPGDMLFVPSGHWHYVRSLSPSFSVNFWF